MARKESDIYKILNIEPNEADLVREYLCCMDYRKVAKNHKLNTNHLKGILRRAGILEVNKRKDINKLREIGMSEKDFL